MPMYTGKRIGMVSEQFTVMLLRCSSSTLTKYAASSTNYCQSIQYCQHVSLFV